MYVLQFWRQRNPRSRLLLTQFRFAGTHPFILFSHGGDCEPSFSSYKDIICIMRVPSSWFYLKLPPKSPPLNTIPLGVKVPIYRFEQERGHEHVGQNIFKLKTENAVCQTKKKKKIFFLYLIYIIKKWHIVNISILTHKRKTYQKWCISFPDQEFKK